MTREEAIKLLVNATYSDEWQGNEDLTTAYNMAIKALEQQPCEDTISRQAAIDALEQAKEQYFDRSVIIGKMQDVVRNLPSA